METSGKRLKRGDVREDGMVFWAYNRGAPWFISRERFEVKSKKARRLAGLWNRSNRAKYLTHKKNWDQRNESWRSNYLRQWRSLNRSKHHQLTREWCAKNIHRVRELNAHKRAHKKNAIPSDVWWEALGENFLRARRISKCVGIKFVVDHIYPLARGGSHCHRNVQVIPASLNQSKHAKVKVDLPSCYRADGWTRLGPQCLEIKRAG